jgi:hypothetical protein
MRENRKKQWKKQQRKRSYFVRIQTESGYEISGERKTFEAFNLIFIDFLVRK